MEILYVFRHSVTSNNININRSLISHLFAQSIESQRCQLCISLCELSFGGIIILSLKS